LKPTRAVDRSSSSFSYLVWHASEKFTTSVHLHRVQCERGRRLARGLEFHPTLGTEVAQGLTGPWLIVCRLTRGGRCPRGGTDEPSIVRGLADRRGGTRAVEAGAGIPRVRGKHLRDAVDVRGRAYRLKGKLLLLEGCCVTDLDFRRVRDSTCPSWYELSCPSDGRAHAHFHRFPGSPHLLRYGWASGEPEGTRRCCCHLVAPSNT
jgi:hypothetical protein